MKGCYKVEVLKRRVKGGLDPFFMPGATEVGESGDADKMSQEAAP